MKLIFLEGLPSLPWLYLHSLFYLMGESDTAVSNNLVACLAKFAHITFIILFGVNLALSYQRNKEKGIKMMSILVIK